jgi:hypothetical protein
MKNILKVIAGSFGIILVFFSGGFYTLFSEGSTANDLLLFVGLFLIGSLLFGFSAGAFKKPLYFLIPLSTALSVILIPDFVPGFHFERGALITLLIVLALSSVIRKYYSIKERKK